MDVDFILRNQYELYGKIARSYENLKKAAAASSLTIGLVEARLQALETNWTKFEGHHEKLVAEHWEVASKHEYTTKKLASTTEETYLNQKALYLDTLYSAKREAAPAAPATTAPPQVVVAAPQPPPRSTLPRIQLPSFSGRYEDWPSFRDLFSSIIEKDTSASKVEKLHYLKASLKGEAELLIRSLPTTGDNFERAWKILTDFYENKRLLTRAYISQFTALQKLKGESASELRKLYHSVRSIVGSLESIQRPITSGEDLFVHLVVELLDPRSRRE